MASVLILEKNRDKIKDEIILERFGVSIIRIRDDGRFNKMFVEEKIKNIASLLNKKLSTKIISD